jgi:hypothetical protein
MNFRETNRPLLPPRPLPKPPFRLPVVLALLLALLAALVVLVALLAALAAVAVLVLPLEAALEVLLLPAALAPPELTFVSPLLVVFVLPLVLLAPPAVTVNLLQSSWAPRCATYDVVVSRRN